MSYRGRQHRKLDPRSGRLYRVIRPAPKALRRRGVRLDNLVLVPGNLLPYKEQWQAIANELPQGEVLIVLPAGDRHQHQTYEKIADLIRAKGHRVTTVSAEQFACQGPISAA